MTPTTILTWISLGAVALVVLLLVFYLGTTLFYLWRTGTRLRALADGLEAITGHTEPLADRLGTINGALDQLGGGLEAIDRQLVTIARVLRLA